MSSGQFRCQACGDLIGTYEPLILWSGGTVREISRASEPALSSNLGKQYHSACYGAEFDRREPTPSAIRRYPIASGDPRWGMPGRPGSLPRSI